MDLLSKEELRLLIQKKGTPCVTIYMPTLRTSPGTKQNPIRFKNLLREAEQRLKAGGLRPSETKELLKPAKALLKDTIFWQHQADGLGIFISTGYFRYYRLPITLKELLVVTDRFHIKPLLHLFSTDGQFYVLALSQNEVRLFQCTRHLVNEIELKGVPRNLNEALQYDQPQKQLHFHTRTPAGGGQRAAIFHGHGAAGEDVKENLFRFFQQVDRGLGDLLQRDRGPAVLAGVEYLFPIYREANTFFNLIETGITGNPEGLRPEELHEGAWKIVEPHFLRNRKEAIQKYREFSGSERVSKDVRKVVPAAYDGRVELLFAAIGIQQWGTFDPGTLSLYLHPSPEPGDEDLFDLAATHTLLNGGTVFAVEPQDVPDKEPLAALFRY